MKFTAEWTNKEVELNTDNLTKLETAVMIAARNNEYEDAINGSTWTFTVYDNAEGITSERQFGGVCSSLTKKGYISIFVDSEDSYFCITEKGKRLFSDYNKKPILINCANDFYQKYFDQVCEALESGEKVEVYIDCIGHTRNNWAQDSYKKALVEKYGDRLTVATEHGAYCYHHIYELEVIA